MTLAHDRECIKSLHYACRSVLPVTIPIIFSIAITDICDISRFPLPVIECQCFGASLSLEEKSSAKLKIAPETCNFFAIVPRNFLKNENFDVFDDSQIRFESRKSGALKGVTC